MSNNRLYLYAIYILGFWIMGVWDVFFRFLESSINLPYPPLAKFFFAFIPSAYLIFLVNIKKNYISLIFSVLVLISWIYFYERYFLSNTGPLYIPLQLISFLIFFIALDLIPKNKYFSQIIEKIIIYSGFFYVAISYLFYLGLVKVGYLEFDIGFERAKLNFIDINQVSYYAVLSITFIIFQFTQNRRSKKSAVLYSLFLLSIVIINSSRGAFIYLLIVIIIYLVNFKILPLIPLISVFIIVLFYGVSNFINISEFSIYYRFTGEMQNVAEQGRSLQILANLENFLENPFLGVGYENAAVTERLRFNWSNNSYTHILASYGIFVWLFMIFVIFKSFFWHKKGSWTKEIYILFSFVFIFYFFTRLFLFPIILSYFFHFPDYFNNRSDNARKK